MNQIKVSAECFGCKKTQEISLFSQLNKGSVVKRHCYKCDMQSEFTTKEGWS